jgi:L-amino acid N-acyltransferase YncA
MYVAPEQRRKGTGRQLGEAMIAHARTRPGVVALRAVVNADDPAALGLFGKLGFTAFGTEPRARLVDGVYHDQVYLYLSLEQ